MRIWIPALLALAAMPVLAEGALDLAAPPIETNETSVRADTLEWTVLFARLGVTDAQWVDLNRQLEPWTAARQELEQTEAKALLAVRTALQAKRDAMLAGGDPPKEVDDALAAASVPWVAAKAKLARSEDTVWRAFTSRFTPEQTLLVQWEFSGPDQRQLQQLQDGYQAQAQRATEALYQIFREPIGRLLTIGATLYRDQRLALLDRMLMTANDRGVLTVYTEEEERLRMQLIELFDSWRQRFYERYPNPTDGEIEETIPYVTSDVLKALGVEVANDGPLQPIVSETELRRVLFRKETAELIAARAELITNAGRQGGVFGRPYGSTRPGGGPPGRGDRGGPGGPGMM